MAQTFDGASILITGGTGSFGRHFVRTVLARFQPRRLVVFSRDETVYAYVFSDNKTYVLSETGTNSQFVMAGDDYALWRDMTSPALPLWKYIKVVG